MIIYDHNGEVLLNLQPSRYFTGAGWDDFGGYVRFDLPGEGEGIYCRYIPRGGWQESPCGLRLFRLERMAKMKIRKAEVYEITSEQADLLHKIARSRKWPHYWDGLKPVRARGR